MTKLSTDKTLLKAARAFRTSTRNYAARKAAEVTDLVVDTTRDKTDQASRKVAETVMVTRLVSGVLKEAAAEATAMAVVKATEVKADALNTVGRTTAAIRQSKDAFTLGMKK